MSVHNALSSLVCVRSVLSHPTTTPCTINIRTYNLFSMSEPVTNPFDCATMQTVSAHTRAATKPQPAHTRAAIN